MTNTQFLRLNSKLLLLLAVVLYVAGGFWLLLPFVALMILAQRNKTKRTGVSFWDRMMAQAEQTRNEQFAESGIGDETPVAWVRVWVDDEGDRQEAVFLQKPEKLFGVWTPLFPHPEKAETTEEQKTGAAHAGESA